MSTEKSSKFFVLYWKEINEEGFLFVVWKKRSMMKAQVVYQRFFYSILFHLLGAAYCRKLKVDSKNDSDQFLKPAVIILPAFSPRTRSMVKFMIPSKAAIRILMLVSHWRLFCRKKSSKILMKYFVSFFLRHTNITSIKMKQNNRPHHCSTSFWAFFKSRDMQKHYIFRTSASKMRFGHDFCRKYTLFWAGKKNERKKTYIPCLDFSRKVSMYL